MSLYQACVPQMAKMIRNLLAWLDKAEAYAKERGFDPETLLHARLAPDQFTLTRQIQSVCDNAKFASYRLAGRAGDMPKHPDEEKTLAELRARAADVLGLIEALDPAGFEGAEERKLELPFLPGKLVRGADYFYEFALPNFYFHVTTAYAILRHNGVPLGKMDFIGGMKLEDA